MDREPDRDGYSTALTALGPVPFFWWEFFLRFRWWLGDRPWLKPVLRLMDRARGGAGVSSAKKLTDLAFINAARWSLVHRVPPSRRWWRRKGRFPGAYLLFEANFNGDTDQYLEAFSLVVASGMRNFWGAKYDLRGAYGIPDVAKVTKFLRYVNDHKSRPSYHYCGYPDASTKMIRCALELERRLAEFRERTTGKGPAEVDQACQRLLREAQYIRNPPVNAKPRPTIHCLTAVAAVDPVSREDLRMDLRTLDRQPTPVPVDRTHFARWVLVDSFDPPPTMARDSTPYLIFSAWFDGSSDAFVESLHERLGGRALQIWRHCGYRGNDAASLRDFLEGHEVKGGVNAAAYDGFTIERIRSAFQRWEAFTELMVDVQHLKGQPLREELIKRGVLRP